MSVSRIFDLLPLNTTNFLKDDIVARKVAGNWTGYSTDEFTGQIDLLSRGLIASGIKKGDKVGIMSPNRPEWNICDFAIMQTGAVSVPLYPTLAEKDLCFILKDAEIKIVFAADQVLADKLDRLKTEQFPDLKIYTFDYVSGGLNWTEVTETGRQNHQINLNDYRDQISPDDLLTLIYTSGTTGTPKGVMLTHDNVLGNVIASSALYPNGFKKALSFLPLSPIFLRGWSCMFISTSGFLFTTPKTWIRLQPTSMK